MRFRRFTLRLRGLLGLFLVAGFQLLAGAVPDAMTAFQEQKWFQAISISIGVLGVFGVVIWSFLQTEPKAELLPPIQIKTPRDTRRGLLVVVSDFKPKNPFDGSIEEAFNKAMSSNNFEPLKLENSNYQPCLQAVQAHISPQMSHERGRLEVVWLMSTTASSSGAHVLAAYLRSIYPTLTVYMARDAGYNELEIPDGTPQDTEVIHRAKAVAEFVFKDAQKRKFKAGDVVADVTGGSKTMSVGLTLACLATDRDIQYYTGDKPTIYGFNTRNLREGS